MRGLTKENIMATQKEKLYRSKQRVAIRKRKKDLTEFQRGILCVSHLGFPVPFVINQ